LSINCATRIKLKGGLNLPTFTEQAKLMGKSLSIYQ